MKSIYRWVVKNQKIPMTLILFLFLLVYSLILISLNAPLWLIYSTVALIAFLHVLFVQSCKNELIRISTKKLNDFCDPIPLFEESERFLTYKNSEADKQVHTINYCVALRYMGEYEKAYEILSNVNIDKTLMMPHENKVIYYNNLSDLCDILDKKEEADIWYDKATQIYSDMKENKRKKSFKNAMILSEASNAIRAGEFENAIKLLEDIMPDHNCMKIDYSFLCAKAYLAKGNVDKTEENLHYIIENGNKLYAVTEAENLLTKI